MALTETLLRLPKNVSSKKMRLCLRLLSLASFTFAIMIGSATTLSAAPVITATPDTLLVNLLSDETALRTLTVSNTGTTNLDFSVSLRPKTGLPNGVSTPGSALGRGAQPSLSAERIAGIMDSYDAYSALDVSTETFIPEMNAEMTPLLSALQSMVGAVSDTSVIFFDDFESFTPGWQHYSLLSSDQWAMSTTRSSSGSSSWHVSQHSGVGADALQTPTINLSGLLSATLAFKHWYNFDDCSGNPTFEPDGGIVEVSTDNGGSWTQIFPIGGYPYTLDDICGNPLAFSNAYSHDGEGATPGQFIPAVFDLNPYVGSSIQIRFHAGWDCGNCGFNEGWYIDDVMVFTENFVSWLSVAPDTVTVLPGGNATVNVTFDATGLFGGDYLADIVLVSNDPVTPELFVPANMHVTGTPDIATSDTTLSFPALFVGTPDNLTFIVKNVGTDILTISAITSSHSDFVSDVSTMALVPSDSLSVTVTFTPSAPGILNETLTIVSDDPADPTFLVGLAGEGLLPPIISSAPDSLVDSLLTGGMAIHTLTIHNTGGSALNYDLEVRNGSFVGTPSLGGQAADLNSNALLRAPVYVESHPTANDSANSSFRFAAAGTYTGANISFGLSNYGEILPFQFPVGNGHLAFGTFLSGFLVAYQIGGIERLAFAEFHNRSSITPVSFTELVNDATRAVISVVVRTTDNALEITRKFTFIKSGAAVGIETEIRNISGGPVDSVDFKCMADLDVDGNFSSNTFAYDPSHNMAYASLTHFVGIAGSTPPDFRDLNGWNDRTIRLTDGQVLDGPATFDGLALIHYQRGTLPAGGAASITTAFGAGNTLADLQLAIERGINLATWLSLSSVSGTVPAGSSANIPVTFDATGLFGGDYFAEISITSNDFATPVLNVPAHLNVTGAPDIALSDTTLNFDSLFIGSAVTRVVTVSNVGTDLLNVTGIGSSHSAYSADVSVFSLSPGASQDVTVTFLPTSAGVINAVLTITSNDADNPSFLVSLTGKGLIPPQIVVAPDSLFDSLFTDAVAVQPLTISNNGGSDLVWSASVTNSSITLSGLYTLTPPDPNATFTTTDSGESAANIPIQESFRTTARQATLSDLTGVKILYDRAHSQSPSSGWGTIIADLTLRGATVIENFSPLTATLLQDVNVYWTTDVSFGWSSTELSALTTWVAGGGGLLLEGDDNSTVTQYNNLLTALGAGITFSTANGSGGTTLSIFPHPTTENVASIFLAGNIARIASITAPAGPLVSDVSGIWNSAYSKVVSGRVVAMADEVFDNTRMGFADNQLFANQVFDWLSNAAAWVQLNPPSGVVNPGQSSILNVTFDATGLFGGDYLADIGITSNDPLNGEVSAATALHVTGVPNISVSPISLVFDTLFVGLSDTQHVLIRNIGTDILTISGITSSNLDFSSSIDTLTLPPLTEQIVVVTFTPSTPTSIAGALTINSDDPDEPAVTVNLQGVGLTPPDIAVLPVSITEILFPLDSMDRILTIENNGGSNLIWSASVRGVIGTANRSYGLTPPTAYYPGSSIPGEPEVPLAPERTSAITAELEDLTDISIMFDRSQGQFPLSTWGVLGNDLILRGATVTENFATIDLSVLEGIDILWITRPSSSLQASERIALAEWTLAGGALAIFNDWTPSYLSYNTLLSDMGAGIQLNSSVFGCTCNITNIHAHQITDSVSSLRIAFSQPTLFPVTSPGGALFSSPTGPPVCAYSSVGFGRVIVSSALMFFNSSIDDADNQLFINQAFDWLARDNWLSLSENSGLVPPNSSGSLTAIFNAALLKTCSDSGQIVITSNDPNKPEVTIPVKLEIDRLPVCVVPNDSNIFYCASAEIRLLAYGIDSCDLGGVVCEVVSGPGVIVAGEWVYSPTGDEIVSVTVRCTDSRGNFCESSFTLTFDENEAPICVLPVDTTIFLCEPTKVHLPISAVDADGNLASCSITGGPGTIENGDWVYTASSDHFTLTRILCVDSCGAYCEKLFRVDFDVNSPPTLACPPDTTVRFNAVLQIQVSATDPELSSYALEELTYSLASGSPSFASINPATGLIVLTPTAADICEHTVRVVATDVCGAADTCAFTVCVDNAPPVITCDSVLTDFCWGQLITGSVSATDSDNGPVTPFYTLASFDGPGTVDVDLITGAWSWQTEEDTPFIGTFNLCISASDGAALCDPCSPQNADTCCVAITVSPTYRVTIETVNMALQGGPVDVTISLADWYESYPLAGYDFLIDYDQTALSITGATEGGFIPGNDWEYFTFRFGTSGNCGSGCPSGKFRVIALANLNNGSGLPSGFTNTSAGSNVLAILHFQVSNDRTLECQMASINWSWYDCGDNGISSVSGDSLFISRYVYRSPLSDSAGALTYEFGDGGVASIHDLSASFPTFFGAPSECDTGNVPGKLTAIRKIDFAGGGVKIACADSIDARGDVNLNGLANEIADAVVFTSYFVHGLSAFNINAAGQTAATEINGDGIPLSVSDLVYLIRVIVGDAVPLPKLSHYARSASITDQGGEISTDTELGAALFVFDGMVDVALLQNNLALVVGLREGNTYALVTPTITAGAIESERIGRGAVLQTDGVLLSTEAADYNGSALRIHSTALPSAFAVMQNYPNPFNPSTKIAFDLAERGSYTVVIYNVAGQKIKEFSGESGPGTVEVTWDAESSSSGIYFYRVKFGKNSVTRKMLLLK